MPNAAEKFEQGAEILQQVDVSKIFTSMAMGIAEAQQKLDNNSIAQLIKLSKEEVSGKSLLELGFVPAFYSFTYADISCNISLQMGLKTDINIGLQASLDLTKNKGYSLDQSKYATENKHKTVKEEHKSSRFFTFKASEKNSVKIESESYSLNHAVGCYSMVENMEHEIMLNEKITDIDTEIHSEEEISINPNNQNVSISKVNGFTCVCLPYKESRATGIFKIKEYDSKKIDLDGDITGIVDDQIEIRTDFLSVFTDAKNKIGSGLVYGFTKDGEFYGNSTTPVDLILYFKHDAKKNIYGQKLGSNVYYNEELKDASETTPKLNSDNLKNAFLKLTEILKIDNEATVTITGYTDTTGDNEYNKELGIKRALAYIRELTSRGAPESSFENPDSKGETESGEDNTIDVTWRKASLKLDADYIIFSGGGFTEDAFVESGSSNEFIYIQENLNDGDVEVNFNYGEVNINVDNAATVTDIKNSINTNYKEFITEEKNNVLYLLNKESVIKFYVFSKEAENISMESAKAYDASGNETENTYYLSDTTTKNNKILDDASSLTTDNTLAIGVSVDARYSRQFDMSAEGNASMSARIVAVPPPQKFKEHVLDNFNSQI
jgi:hypothetical protein